MPLCCTLTKFWWLNKEVVIFYSCSFPDSLFFSIALSFLTLTFHKSLLCASLWGVGGTPYHLACRIVLPQPWTEPGPVDRQQIPRFFAFNLQNNPIWQDQSQFTCEQTRRVTYLKLQNFSYVELSPDSLQCFFFFTSFPLLCFLDLLRMSQYLSRCHFLNGNRDNILMKSNGFQLAL